MNIQDELIFGIYPHVELSDKEVNERAEKVKDILSRGKKAIFTRPHRMLSGDVRKVVTEWNVNIDEDIGLYDIEASESNGSTSWIALWDASYTITEE